MKSRLEEFKKAIEDEDDDPQMAKLKIINDNLDKLNKILDE
jgi:hypothetical protein